MNKKSARKVSFNIKAILIVLLILVVGIFIFSFSTKNPQEVKKGLGALPGDANGDGTINILDFQILSNSFGKSQGQTEYNAGADFNTDQTVNVLDFQILSNNFGRISTSTSPSPTPPSGESPTPIQANSLISTFTAIRSQTLWPVPHNGVDKISSTFGPRIRVSTNGYDFHAGIDISGSLNSAIVAPLDGILWDVTVYPSGGTTVILRHDFPNPVQYSGKVLNYFYTFYMHLNSVTESLSNAASFGQHPEVPKGFEVGKMGHSGNAISDHLHWEMRVGSWCSLESQLANPASSCSGFNFDPAMHPLLLYPPQTENPRLSLITTPTSIEDGKITFTSNRNQPVLNRIYLSIEDKTSGQVIKSHILDLNQRLGFNPRSASSLDNPDKTKPYFSPVTFGVSAPIYTINIIIPKIFVGATSGPEYRSTLTATNIWGNTATISW